MSQIARSSTEGSDGNSSTLPKTVNGFRSHDLQHVYSPIETELKNVESVLRNELKSETPFVDQLLQHSWLMGGKRIRPVFLLLSAASCGDITQPHLQMAAALEMIHTATLVHDDVLDEAHIRRHRATANSEWGNKVSVLLGDYLFTNAFHVASQAGSAEALRMLAQASNRVCEGEMKQNASQGDFDMSEDDYLRMITEKTAELCGVGCRLGAFLSGADCQQAEQFECYGRSLGVAFQIIDDVLDIVGDQSQVGKTLGTDIANQKATLPIIHCLENSSPEQRVSLKNVLVDRSSTSSDVLPHLNRTASIEYSRRMAEEQARLAIEFSETLDVNEFSVALKQLAHFVLDRTH